MRSELRILGPVVLILLAGYFASYPSALPGEQSPVLLKGPSSLTGASVVATGTCQADKVLFKISGLTNAHAETYDQTNYAYEVCWDSAPISTDRTCDGKNGVVALSAITNAHAEEITQGVYNEQVCYGELRCISVNQTTACTPGSQCVATLSAATNAHVGDCTSGYPIKICCGDGFVPGGGGGPGVPKTDTDKDGVYDDGDGNGVGNNPCNPNVHTTFATCDDNCIDIPNGPLEGTCFGGTNDGQLCLTDLECPSGVCQLNQEDQDTDGAGDVCDADPTNSCTIVTPGDNCQNYGACAASLQAQWLESSVVEGNAATLEVTGDPSCANLTFVFTVLENTGAGVVQSSPQPATFTSGKVTSTWQGEYHTTGSNTYYFQATSQQGVQVSSPQSALLTVTPVAPGGNYCGDGKVQFSQGEECDEGSNNCKYTQSEVESSGSTKTCGPSEVCYDDCQLIPGPGGQSCRTAPECQGMPSGLFAVCQPNNPTEVQFCIKGAGGCLQLSNAQPCSSVGGVQNVCVPNLPSCQSPTCNYQTSAGSCQGSSLQLTCTSTGGSHCKGCSGYPRTEACFEEPQEDFPFYNWWNVLLTVILLATFYGFRKNVHIKDQST